MINEQNVTSKEQKVTSSEQRVKSNVECIESNEQRAESNQRGAKSKTKKKNVASKEEKISLLFSQVMVADKTKQTKSTEILQYATSKLRDYTDHTNVELQTLLDSLLFC